jgi:hypothetical protein
MMRACIHQELIAVGGRILWLPIFQRDVKEMLIFVVENTTRALQEFAANYRGFFNFPSSG